MVKKLRLERFKFTNETTIGKLYIDDIFFCYTLEDKVRDLGVKVYGKTAIPYGKHSLTISYSNRFKVMMPLIYNRTDWSVRDGHGVKFGGVRVHWGNFGKDTEGCILVGATYGSDFIGTSKKTYNKLMVILADIDIVKLEIVEV